MKLFRIALCLWLLCVGGAWAQTTDQGIIVTGEGRVSAPPDMATITLGVTERAATAGAVMGQVTGAVAQIIAALDAMGVAPQDRQTSGFYLHPLHEDRVRQQDAAPKIAGYQAGNSVTVRVRDLTKLGQMMDGVIAIGANDFNGLRFGLQDSAPAMAEARARAVEDAMDRARQLADAAGLQLGAVLRITEASPRGGPVMMEMAGRAAMRDAIAEGEVDVTAQVTMVFAIAPGQ